MNDRISHRADEAEALRAHDFGDEVRVDLTEATRDRAQKICVQAIGRELENGLESSFVNQGEHCGLGRGRHGGARLPVEQRHFAEEVSRLNERERFLIAAAPELGDLD